MRLSPLPTLTLALAAALAPPAAAQEDAYVVDQVEQLPLILLPEMDQLVGFGAHAVMGAVL